LFSIGKASRMSGLTPETIRYYELSGVVPAPGRAGNGRRLYTEAEVGRLRFVRRCRDLGFPVAEARALLELSEAEDRVCSDVRDMARAHLETVRSRIAELQELADALSTLIGKCNGGGNDCEALRWIKTGS